MVNVFSFCLYGPPMGCNGPPDKLLTPETMFLTIRGIQIVRGGYYHGLLENIYLIQQHFPEWKVYVYAGGDVPQAFLDHLSETYSNVVIRPTGVVGHINSIHRFFAIDESDVDLMMCRDADSRVHWRDRWAIHWFLSHPKFPAMAIHDNKVHSGIPAGLWGVRKGAFPVSLRFLYDSWSPVHKGYGNPNDVRGFGIDQNFLLGFVNKYLLSKMVFITIKPREQYRRENIVHFPFKWSNNMYTGRIECKPIEDNFWIRERDILPPEETHPSIETNNSLRLKSHRS